MRKDFFQSAIPKQRISLTSQDSYHVFKRIYQASPSQYWKKQMQKSAWIYVRSSVGEQKLPDSV